MSCGLITCLGAERVEKKLVQRSEIPKTIPQGLKPRIVRCVLAGTSKLVPFQNSAPFELFRSI